MHPALFADRLRCLGYAVTEHVLTVQVEHVHKSSVDYREQMRDDISQAAPGALVASCTRDEAGALTRTCAVVTITGPGDARHVGGARA